MNISIEEVYLKNKEKFHNKADENLAFGELIEASLPFILKVYKKYLINSTDFDDWHSDAQFTIFRCVEKYRGNDNAKFTTYLYQALVNKAKDIIRVNNRVKNINDAVSLENLVEKNFDIVDYHAVDPEAFASVNYQFSKLKKPKTEQQIDIWQSIFSKNLDKANYARQKYGNRKFVMARARMIRQIKQQILL